MSAAEAPQAGLVLQIAARTDGRFSVRASLDGVPTLDGVCTAAEVPEALRELTRALVLYVRGHASLALKDRLAAFAGEVLEQVLQPAKRRH